MNKKFILLGAVFTIIVLFSIPSSFGESGEMTTDEFKEALEKPTRDYQYIQDQFDFPILEREFSKVYGDMANGNVEEAIRIFSDPDYPESVFGNNEPTISLDGISKTELIQYYPLLILIILILVVFYYWKKSKSINKN